MNTQITRMNPQDSEKIKRYVLIDQNDKSVYETTSFDDIKNIANITQLLQIYKVFWLAERIDDYNVAVWHEYHISGAHNAVVCTIESIRPNKVNQQILLEDINYYTSRKENKKELLKDLKRRRKESGNKEHFDKKIRELKEIFKVKDTDKLYTCDYTGAIVKQIGQKYRAINGFGKTPWHIKAVTIKHDACEDTIGCTYEYALSELTKIKKKNKHKRSL